jgi:hypothetical protein
MSEENAAGRTHRWQRLAEAASLALALHAEQRRKGSEVDFPLSGGGFVNEP